MRQLYIIGILFFMGFLISPSLYAQQRNTRSSNNLKRQPIGGTNAGACGTDAILFNKRKDPASRANEEAMNRIIANASRLLPGDTLTLPVVVHIINQNPFSFTDANIIAGIQNLNDAFSKAGAYAASPGVDTKIRFCIAKKDPDGGNTTGITRTTSFMGDDLNMDNEDGRLKNLIMWDPTRFINIWLVSSIHGEAYADYLCGQWYRLNVGGYATLPTGGDVDGIVITGMGVLPHEMGHYLGLYHTFQGGCTNGNCLTDGDNVCDTPPDNSVRPSAACNNPQNSCDTDTLSSYSNGAFPADVPDQITNFMDYGNGGCSIEFTQGQADRMRAAILTQRAGLLQDECTAPCNENILASFTRNIAQPILGDVINFTNTSTGVTNYEWSVDGTVMATTPNFSYTFNAMGKFKVTLKVFNTPGCFATSTDYVVVNCGVVARFWPDKKTIASLAGIMTDSIVFTNSSYQGVTYQWLVSNTSGMPETLIATTTNLTYVFAQPSTYYIRLIATNGSCSDTTLPFVVPVADPTPDASPGYFSYTCYQQNKIWVSFCIDNSGYAPIPPGTPVSFYDGDPTLPTSNRLPPTLYLPYETEGNCEQCYNHILNVDYHGVMQLYMVINDSGNNIPLVMPNTTLTESFYYNNTVASWFDRTTISKVICQGDSYGGHTTTGTYIDTLSSYWNGCDSIRTLYLTVKPTYNTTVTTSICQGDNYAGHTATGTYVDVFMAVNSCDSTRTLHLTVKPTYNTTVTTSICQGENYAGHTTTGTYVDVYNAANGCDSTRTLNLTVKPKATSLIAISICQGENYAGHTVSGTYTDVYTAANGCDSSRTLVLTVKPTVTSTITASICQGETFAGYSATGTFTDVFTASNGCDSTRTLHLTVRPTAAATVTTSICQGENYAGHTTSGTFTDVYMAANGCDSTRTLHLTVKPTVTTSFTSVICQGESVAGHTTTGTYVEVFTAANGCDSTRTLQLTVNPTKFTTVNVSRCLGESYLAGGQLQTTAGVYYDTASTYLGCDSVIKTILTINPLPSPQLGGDRKICFGDVVIFNPGSFTSYEWQDGNINQTYSAYAIGDYWVTVSNTFGCKATDTVRLIEIFTLPANFLPKDSSLCRGNTLRITVPDYFDYTWSTGSGSSSIDVAQTGAYTLEVKDGNNCIGNDTINVLFKNCINIQVPNAFTPNDDNLNDVFKPKVPAPVTNYQMSIWNQWGELLFETHDYKKGWNGMYKGTKQSMGAYVYIITLKDVDGVNVKKSGSFVLIR